MKAAPTLTERIDGPPVITIALEIASFCVKWGRINVLFVDEKKIQNQRGIRTYVLFFVSFGLPNLAHIIHPQGQDPESRRHWWEWPFEMIAIPFLKIFQGLIMRWQFAVYKSAYAIALEKYPRYYENILAYAQYPEIINM